MPNKTTTSSWGALDCAFLDMVACWVEYVITNWTSSSELIIERAKSLLKFLRKSAFWAYMWRWTYMWSFKEIFFKRILFFGQALASLLLKKWKSFCMTSVSANNDDTFPCHSSFWRRRCKTHPLSDPQVLLACWPVVEFLLEMRSVGAVEVGCYRHGHGFSGAIEDKTPSTCINL
jgi:hypothetical protein